MLYQLKRIFHGDGCGPLYWVLVLALGCLVLVGCGSKPQLLMTTPGIYTHPDWNPFAEIPTDLQGNQVEVLYVTDRVPEKVSPDQMEYGHKRSRSTAFGECVLQIGNDDLSWDELVLASRTAKREKELELKIASTRELARFPMTPAKLFISDEDMTHGYANDDPAGPEAMKAFLDELTTRLAKTPRKEVFIYVHGFNNSFEDAIVTTGEFWHFLGREGVPIAYTWPAGEGALRAYGYTEQSSQFTVHHLKQMLRLIASCPAVEKIHIAAHSRGTDVASSAILELHLETRGVASTQQKLKFGTLVLAAPDMDIDVVTQRLWSERFSQAFERVVVYIHKHDKALGLSTWLTGGTQRLGDVELNLFDPDEVHSLRGSERNQYIEARVTEAGSFGHDYYRANPAVSSDLILLLRYRLPPGGAHGRPLGVSDKGFWIIDDKYPGSSDTWLEAIKLREKP